jgi:glycogen(starch) synthase
MRILLCSELFWPYIGGAEILMAELMSSMHRMGYQVAVATSHTAQKLPDQVTYKGLKIYRFHFHKALSGRDLHQITCVRKMLAELRSTYKPEIVHLNNITPDTFFHIKTSAVYPAPTILTLHNPISIDNYHNNTLVNRVLRYTDRIVTVSNSIYNQIEQIAPEHIDKSTVIQNALDIPKLEPKPLPFDPIQILCIGRLFPFKGFDLAIDAFAAVSNNQPDITLVIAGDGPLYQDLKQKVKNLNLADRVKFLGWVDPEYIPELLNKSTIIVLPSRSTETQIEGLPLVALQTAIMARPIIATKVGGVPEVVKHGKTGFLVEPEDIQGLEENLLHLIQNPVLATNMGLSARKKVKEFFSWEKFVKQYKDIYLQLVQS